MAVDQRRSLTLAEMVAQITPENRHPKFSFGVPRGREIIGDDINTRFRLDNCEF